MRTPSGDGLPGMATTQKSLVEFDETLRKSPATGGWTYVVWGGLPGPGDGWARIAG